VANILEGSVRQEGSHVRITAELTKAEDGFQLWSHEYNTELKDIFAVQDEIARAVTGALQIKLLGANATSAATATRVANPDAYQAYLQGYYFSDRGSEKANYDKALAYAEQAIKLDPDFSDAWALRSSVVAGMATEGFMDTGPGLRRAREDAEQAIALDPHSALGYLALAGIRLNYDFDWDGTEAALKQAAALQPGSVDLLASQADLAETLGQLDEGIGNGRSRWIRCVLPVLYFWGTLFFMLEGTTKPTRYCRRLWNLIPSRDSCTLYGDRFYSRKVGHKKP
jgi:tetratricopeptide (TPR) repeat protein